MLDASPIHPPIQEPAMEEGQEAGQEARLMGAGQEDAKGPQLFDDSGQTAIKSTYWLKGFAMGLIGVVVAVLLGVTQKLEPLNDMDIYSADDDDAHKIILTTLLPAFVLGVLGLAGSGPISGRFGADMLKEMSKDMDPKESALSSLENVGLLLALLLTMILGTLQKNVSFDTRFAIFYRLLNIFAIECALRGLVMCILVTLYMQPLNKAAAVAFASDNLQYLGEPITAMILCTFYFVNVMILWEFGTNGIWIGILVSLLLCYCLTRKFVVFLYLSSWKNPQISDEVRERRKKQAKSVCDAGLKVNVRPLHRVHPQDEQATDQVAHG